MTLNDLERSRCICNHRKSNLLGRNIRLVSCTDLYNVLALQVGSENSPTQAGCSRLLRIISVQEKVPFTGVSLQIAFFENLDTSTIIFNELHTLDVYVYKDCLIQRCKLRQWTKIFDSTLPQHNKTTFPPFAVCIHRPQGLLSFHTIGDFYKLQNLSN